MRHRVVKCPLPQIITIILLLLISISGIFCFSSYSSYLLEDDEDLFSHFDTYHHAYDRPDIRHNRYSNRSHHNHPVSRIRRSVRPTKSYDFKESDGSMAGAIMFQLDKKHSNEIFKIESPNRWVTVDMNGAVRIKESWDYEQLGKEKTIDFWVFVTGPNLNGQYPDRNTHHEIHRTSLSQKYYLLISSPDVHVFR